MQIVYNHCNIRYTMCLFTKRFRNLVVKSSAEWLFSALRSSHGIIILYIGRWYTSCHNTINCRRLKTAAKILSCAIILTEAMLAVTAEISFLRGEDQLLTAVVYYLIFTVHTRIMGIIQCT